MALSLKTNILLDLKSRIDKVSTPEQLAALQKEIMGDKKNSNQPSAEFRVLKKHQGLIPNIFIKTKSQQAVEKMFENKRRELEVANQGPKTNNTLG